MNEAFIIFTETIARLLELSAVVLIAVGAIEAIIKLLYNIMKKHSIHGFRRKIWLNFAQWILLGLEFTMAADIVKTALAPTWDSIGQLAAIALTRTFLSYFLERDLEVNKPDIAP